MADEPKRLSDPNYWQGRYEEGSAHWDLGAPPPVVMRLAREFATPVKVLVPGAGSGHDAFGWARAGHETTAFDFAPAAVDRARGLAVEQGLAVDLAVADAFALPADWRGRFDVVFEQTLLCAIDPARRGEYVDAMADVLAPGGSLLAVLWNHGNSGGPPYDLTPEIVRPLLATRFEVDAMEPLAPGEHPRAGQFLVRARPRP